MKKLYIATLSLLISTSMTQADQPRGPIPQEVKNRMDQNLTKALGGNVTLPALSTFAQGLSPAIAHLATSAQPKDVIKVMEMYKTIGTGLLKLTPKPNPNNKRTQDQIKSDLMTAVGGTLTFASLSNYASQLPTSIATLTESSTADLVVPVVNMHINIGEGLKQLAPKPVN